MERVWGGRELERVYGRKLPDPVKPVGESWELVDREEIQSIVENGPFAGTSLHELWTLHGEDIFGSGYENHLRFPLLIKILDARDDLSIQVHPPEHRAAELGGEAKSEMWYIADCKPGAKLYVGLKPGITKADFEHAIETGSVADCVHVITPKPGDSIFIPSGRLHAIGAGFLIHEIQQNSDTTYRVFDWNRQGLDGKPRQLHVDQSLASIDFNDFEPGLEKPNEEVLATCEYFIIDRKLLLAGSTIGNPIVGKFSIVSVIEGKLESDQGRRFGKGQVLLLPRDAAALKAVEDSTVLQVTLP